MNTSQKFAHLFTTALLTSPFAFAQAPALPVPPPPPMPSAAPRPPMEEGLREITTMNGTVGSLQANDDAVYDGFEMQTGGKKMLVKFPPHLGSQITKMAGKGSSVTVKGVSRVSPEGTQEFRMVSLESGSQTVTDAPPAMPATPPVEEPVSGSGKITKLQTGRAGDVHGFVVDGRTIVKLPPHIMERLRTDMHVGSSVSYTGNKRPENTGEVSAEHYTIVNAATLRANGKEYLVR